MAYATIGALTTRYGGTKFDGLTAQASAFLDDATNEMNKYLGKRYDLSSVTFQTTTSYPPQVIKLCTWLALGYLYEANSRGSKESFQRADRYIKPAMENLFHLRDYKAELIDSSGDVIADDSTNMQITSSTDGYAPTFNEDDPLNWTVDPTKISDISSDRS